jgi:hypothetical protein
MQKLPGPGQRQSLHGLVMIEIHKLPNDIFFYKLFFGSLMEGNPSKPLKGKWKQSNELYG